MKCDTDRMTRKYKLYGENTPEEKNSKLQSINRKIDDDENFGFQSEMV